MKEVIERLKEKSNECAFPFVSAETFSMGMSMRDYFAAMAMQANIGLLNGGAETLTDVQIRVAESAYQIADAMLKVRGK